MSNLSNKNRFMNRFIDSITSLWSRHMNRCCAAKIWIMTKQLNCTIDADIWTLVQSNYNILNLRVAKFVKMRHFEVWCSQIRMLTLEEPTCKCSQITMVTLESYHANTWTLGSPITMLTLQCSQITMAKWPNYTSVQPNYNNGNIES
jgi:hypothetical protein